MHPHFSPEVPLKVKRALAAAVVPFILATVVGVVLLWPRGVQTDDSAGLGPGTDLWRARVVSAAPAPCEGSHGPVELQCIAVSARLSEGPSEGESVRVEIVDESNAPDVRAGDRVILGHSPDAPPPFNYYFNDFERRVPLIALGALFAAVVVALGRWKGLMALAGFALSLAILIFFVLPAILGGTSPLAVAIVGASAVMLGALYMAHGVNVRTTTAALGTFGSLALTGLLALLFVEGSRLTGFSSEEAVFLNLRASQINLQGLVLAGIIIGSLGVLDDVTITQASAVWELRLANPSYGFRELYRSALVIGRDHIASTVNTLLLAYAGAALPLFILFTLAETKLGTVVNSEIVAEEIVRTLVGSIGLVAAVPITTGLAALVVSRATPAQGGSSDRT